ncbi:hypothetical protein LTR53_015218 [Teratosphaeriaceae sp. CCFEE 6253]|nr:hypothetical protein LTR53_015218 [Teratosphaeriaceae sp. CCFEE 6253]
MRRNLNTANVQSLWPRLMATGPRPPKMDIQLPTFRILVYSGGADKQWTAQVVYRRDYREAEEFDLLRGVGKETAEEALRYLLGMTAHLLTKNVEDQNCEEGMVFVPMGVGSWYCSPIKGERLEG